LPKKLVIPAWGDDEFFSELNLVTIKPNEAVLTDMSMIYCSYIRLSPLAWLRLLLGVPNCQRPPNPP
jgi:hypothetical protein